MTSSLTADDSRRRPSRLALLALLALRLIMACTMHTILLQPIDYQIVCTLTANGLPACSQVNECDCRPKQRKALHSWWPDWQLPSL